MAEQATDLRDGMEVASGGEPAAANQDTPKGSALAQSLDPSANIIMRLWRAELDIGAVEKSQTATIKNDAGATAYTYKFTGYDKVLAAVKPAVARHGIKVLPTTTKHERTGNLSVVTVAVDFINVDLPTDKITVEMTNYGADKGDKGASKALTNAVREAIKKALGITSEEDDRADETTEFDSQEGASRQDMTAVLEQRRAAIEQWAKVFKLGLEKARTKADVARLERENRDQLASDDLPDVTRAFFAELITERKAALA